MSSDGLTRREAGALLAAGLVGLGAAAKVTSPSAPGRVGVAAARGELDPSTARVLVGSALAAAVPGAADGVAAARALFAADDVVGIKVNCLAGPLLSPRPQLVAALADLVAAAGVSRSRIIVFDRASDELRRAGFVLRHSGGAFLCYGTDNDYDRQPTESGAIGSCFARLVSTTCTALVSFGVVKDHDLAGVSAGLKNWYGVIHNPNKYHDNNCDPYLADIVRHPIVRSRHRLTVLDGLRAQCHGGPALNLDGLWDLGRVVASTDPLACDLWAWREIDRERRRRGLPSLEEDGRPPRFDATAAAAGLGVGQLADLREITA